MKSCIICNKTLTGKQRRYCGRKCNNAARTIITACLECGSPLPAGSHSKICDVCREVPRPKQKVKHTCARCSAPLADGRQKLCSVCRQLGYRAITGTRRIHAAGRYTCGWCGKRFSGYKKTYCSAECRAASKREPAPKIVTLPGLTERRSGNTCRYCGTPCIGRYCSPQHEYYDTHYVTLTDNTLCFVPIRADGR